MIDEATALTQAARSEAPVDGDGDWARPLLERQLEMLGRLAEDGLEISRAIARQAAGAGRTTVSRPRTWPRATSPWPMPAWRERCA